jgi:TetR/AcrR family fatty acid metabolism transcriptional regulator
MGKRDDNSRRQREAITSAAVSVFSKKGFHQASVEEIARRAGVGKGTVYLYFDDKSRLFAAAVAEGIESIIADLRAELESDLPFPQHLERLLKKNVSLYLEYGDLTRIFSNELSSGLERKARNEIEQVRDRYIDFIAETLAEGHRRGYIRGIDFRLAAIGMVGMLDSLCSHQLQNREPGDRERLLQTVIALLSSGLIAKSQT